MRKTLSKPLRTAVTVTAVLLFLILTAVWIFLAVIEVHTVSSHNFSTYTETKTVAQNFYADDMEKLPLSSYAGVYVSVAYENGVWTCHSADTFSLQNLVSAVYNKIYFLNVDAVDEKDLPLLLDYCLQNLSYKTYILSSDTDRLECCYTYSKRFVYFGIADNGLKSYYITKTGYNLALPLKKASSSRITRSHENDHLFCAFLSSAQDLSTARFACIDYAILPYNQHT